MLISYKPLKDYMYYNDILVSDLVKAGINSRTMANIGKGEYVSLKTIVKICLILDIPIEQVVEIKTED